MKRMPKNESFVETPEGVGTVSQVNLLRAQKREHSRKPDEFIPLIERCSPGPFLELFARGDREGWAMWGNQATAEYEPTWNTYKNHTKKPEDCREERASRS